MKLEWKMKLLVKLMKLAGNKPFHQSTPKAIRAQEKLGQRFFPSLIFGKVVPLPHVEDMEINGRSTKIPIRVYRPTLDEKRPLLLFFHGGGWVLGSLDTHDRVCRNLAFHSGRVVVSVAYRLAPENKYPAAVEDACDALVWVAENGAALGADTKDIAVAGDSAGGNITAVLCQKARDEKGPKISKQLLIYPAVDLSQTYPSAITFAEAPILSRKDMDWFAAQYVQKEEDCFDAGCSPLLGPLQNLPATFILTAEYDPLRDQGAAYAKALEHNMVIRSSSSNTLVRYTAFSISPLPQVRQQQRIRTSRFF